MPAPHTTTNPTNPIGAADTTGAESGPVLLQLPVAELTAHPANLRFDLGDVSSLAASITEHGLIEPVIVAPLADGSGYRIVAGHRRTAAVQHAGLITIAAVIRPDLTTRGDATSVEHLGTMLAENTQRDDLTIDEINSGIVQLAAFPGMTPTRLARTTGRSADQVKHALAAATLPEDVRPLVHAETMTLQDAVALAEFEDDPATYARLLAKISTAGPGRASYLISDERRKQSTKAEKAAALAALRNGGCTSVPAPASWQFPHHTRMQPLTNLRTSTGKKITALTHRKCAGHAAFLRVSDYQPEGHRVTVTYVCTDPETHYHVLIEDYPRRDVEPDPTDAEAAAQAEEQERIRSEWASASDQRRDWLTTLLRGKKIPDELARAALKAHTGRTSEVYELLTGQPVPDDPARDADDAAESVYAELVAREPVARLHRHTVAYLITEHEHAARRFDPTDRAPWNADRVADWLRLLARIGYELTDADRAATAAWPPEPTDHDGDSRSGSEAAENDGSTTEPEGAS